MVFLDLRFRFFTDALFVPVFRSDIPPNLSLKFFGRTDYLSRAGCRCRCDARIEEDDNIS